MIKWIVLAVAVYVLYRLFANDFFRRRQKEEELDEKEMERKVAAGEMAKDPMCGTYVSVEDSISVRDGDNVHYFCSYDCREKYLMMLSEKERELPDNVD